MREWVGDRTGVRTDKDEPGCCWDGLPGYEVSEGRLREGNRRRTENCETSPSPSMKVSRVGSHVPRSAKYLDINIKRCIVLKIAFI